MANPPSDNPPQTPLTPQHVAFLATQRVGHLSTADASGRPHVIPVCYALLGQRIYTAIDEKPKRRASVQLKRVRNILENPRVALVVDRYDDDWARLGYVLVLGTAEVMAAGEEHHRAIGELQRRYPQYQGMALKASPVIAIRVDRAVAWGNLEP